MCLRYFFPVQRTTFTSQVHGISHTRRRTGKYAPEPSGFSLSLSIPPPPSLQNDSLPRVIYIRRCAWVMIGSRARLNPYIHPPVRAGRRAWLFAGYFAYSMLDWERRRSDKSDGNFFALRFSPTYNRSCTETTESSMCVCLSFFSTYGLCCPSVRSLSHSQVPLALSESQQSQREIVETSLR